MVAWNVDECRCGDGGVDFRWGISAGNFGWM